MLHKNEQYIVIGCIAQFPTHKSIDNYFQVKGYFYIKAITLCVKLKIETDQSINVFPHKKFLIGISGLKGH